MRKRHISTLPPVKRRAHVHGLGGANRCAVPCCTRRIPDHGLFCPGHSKLISREDADALNTAQAEISAAYKERGGGGPKSGPTPRQHRANLQKERLVQQIACRLSDAEWQMKEAQA